MIDVYVTSMNKFASDTRNVHKEIKETLLKTCILLTQYKKVKNDTPSVMAPNPAIIGEKQTETNVATEKLKKTNENMDGPIMTTLAKIQGQLAAQQKSIEQIVAERDRQQHSAYKEPSAVVHISQPTPSEDIEDARDLTWTKVVKQKKKKAKPAPINMPEDRAPVAKSATTQPQITPGSNIRQR